MSASTDCLTGIFLSAHLQPPVFSTCNIRKHVDELVDCHRQRCRKISPALYSLTFTTRTHKSSTKYKLLIQFRFMLFMFDHNADATAAVCRNDFARITIFSSSFVPIAFLVPPENRSSGNFQSIHSRMETKHRGNAQCPSTLVASPHSLKVSPYLSICVTTTNGTIDKILSLEFCYTFVVYFIRLLIGR